MSIANVIALLSGVALFLFGMTLMGDGLKKVAGSKLELILYRLTGTPLKAAILGTGVTTVIQSSSATSVMVVGFVNSGIMKVRQAIATILGAILGTAITGWIICLGSLSGGGGVAAIFSTKTLSGIIAIIGIILRMFCKKQSYKHFGDILMGFAVLMFGMSAMSGSVSELRENEAFIKFMTTFSNPFIGIFTGIILTAIIQSASAAVGILQALAASGAIDFASSLPMLLGIAIGASLPVIISAAGASVNARRSAWSYLVIGILGCVTVGIIFYVLNAIFGFSFMGMSMTSVSIAALNTVYRLAVLIVLLPLVNKIEDIVVKLIKDKDGENEESAEIEKLDDRFIEHPALAIESSRRAMCSMAYKSSHNLGVALGLLYEFDQDEYNSVIAKEDIIDRYEDKLGTYLVKITQKELDHGQNIEISKFLHTISDIERIADHAVNIAESALEIHEKKIKFSPDAKNEVDTLEMALARIVDITNTAFIDENTELAYKVEPLEELIDDLCDEAKLNHVQRLQAGNCALDQGFVFNDLLTNFERIADHCSNIAVAMIELELDAFDTHEYLNTVKKVKSENFTSDYEKYRREFSFEKKKA